MAWRTDSPGQEFPVGFDFAYLLVLVNFLKFEGRGQEAGSKSSS